MQYAWISESYSWLVKLLIDIRFIATICEEGTEYDHNSWMGINLAD